MSERPKVQISKVCVVHSHPGFESQRYRHDGRGPAPRRKVAAPGLVARGRVLRGRAGRACSAFQRVLLSSAVVQAAPSSDGESGTQPGPGAPPGVAPVPPPEARSGGVERCRPV